MSILSLFNDVCVDGDNQISTVTYTGPRSAWIQVPSFAEEGRCILEDGWDSGAQVCVGDESGLLHGISTCDSKEHPHS